MEWIEVLADLVEVFVATVGRAHGIKGEVGVELRTDSPELRFTKGAQLRIDGTAQMLTVAGTRWHGEKLLVRFVGFNDRTSVEAIRGAVLGSMVPADEPTRDSSEFYDRQLIGLRVLDDVGAEVGQVVEVSHLPGQDLLVIATADGERMVPFVRALIPVVDLEDGYLQLAAVDGLLGDLED